MKKTEKCHKERSFFLLLHSSRLERLKNPKNTLKCGKKVISDNKKKKNPRRDRAEMSCEMLTEIIK